MSKTIAERKAEAMQQYTQTAEHIKRLQQELQASAILLEQQRGALMLLEELEQEAAECKPAASEPQTPEASESERPSAPS